MRKSTVSGMLVAFLAVLALPLLSAGPAQAAGGSTVTPNSSVFSGTLQPGASKSWVHNNAGTTNAFAVGLNPQGASTSTPCDLQVSRTWYVQQPDGENEFHFTITNNGDLACGADILVTSETNAVGAWSTGGVDPGSSVSKSWINYPAGRTFLVGLAPTGATASATCQFEITKQWYTEQPDGSYQFHFTAANVGSIACSASILLAGNDGNLIATRTLAAGASTTVHWNNANPLTDLYLQGLEPVGATSTTACRYQLTNSWYQQVIDPPAEREYYFTVKNIGDISCSVEVWQVALAS